MLSIFKKIFPSKHEKDINSISPVVDEINVFYEEFESLSDEQLKEKTNEFKQKIISETEEINNKISELQKGLTDDLTHNERMNIHDEIDLLKKENYDVINAVLDEILPEAFAVVKQTCKRLCGTEWEAAGNKIKWNMVPYDVQLIGGVVLHQGKIAEMATGEGKTLVATLPLYLNALAGKGVHLITVNDYLAKRDSEWMGEIFKFLGLTIGVILNDMDPNKRREMYNCDITYGTNNEFGFDYLRDNMVVDKEFLVQREHFYAIVDEVDSVLIDEARTPLIISGPVEISKHKYDEINPKIKRLVEAQKNLVNKLTAEAEAIVSQENVSSEDSAKAGLALLRANHALPNHKKLQKLLSEPSNKKLLLASEAEYMRDNSKQMHIVDDELYFIIEEKSHVTDLTEKGREFLAPSLKKETFSHCRTMDQKS